eukprot:5540831-Prymnesium_polylepis.1
MSYNGSRVAVGGRDKKVSTESIRCMLLAHAVELRTRDANRADHSAQVVLYAIEPKEDDVPLIEDVSKRQHQRKSAAPAKGETQRRPGIMSRAETIELSSADHLMLERDTRTSVGRQLWEVESEDFIYSVAVSSDLQFCAFGGTAMTLMVVEGRTGTYLFDIPCSGSIWSVTFLNAPMPSGKTVPVRSECFPEDGLAC